MQENNNNNVFTNETIAKEELFTQATQTEPPQAQISTGTRVLATIISIVALIGFMYFGYNSIVSFNRNYGFDPAAYIWFVLCIFCLATVILIILRKKAAITTASACLWIYLIWNLGAVVILLTTSGSFFGRLPENLRSALLIQFASLLVMGNIMPITLLIVIKKNKKKLQTMLYK